MSLLVTISSSTHGSVLAFSLLLGLLLSVSPPPFQLTEKMFYNSAHRKVLRITGRGRDSPNNNNDDEPEDEYGSFPIHLFDELETKDEYLIDRGANLFKELVKTTRGKNNSFRIFSLEELLKATNNFSADLNLRDSWNPTYRGIIEDRHVALKLVHWFFMREVVSLSLIKHRNVVKLQGCCLETNRIILVHEVPPNGTLKQNISKLSWTDRLRIATEIADVVAYLHSELNMIHERLYAPEAVLLDEFHSAKLGAFDFAKIQNKTESSDVETDIRNKHRKRDDVFHFGTILLNLLDIYDFGKVDSYNKVEILKYVKLNVSEKEMPQIEAYMDLLLRCRDREDELSIEEVVQELRRIRSMISQQ